jgi:LacI family transcriptional regulator
VNQSPDVSDDVRKRVLGVIESTGYQPHAAARALASQRSWTIGLLLPQSVSSFFTDPYFPHLTRGIAQACNHYNYTLALFLVGTKTDEEKIFPRLSRPGFVDGVIVQSGHHGEQWIIGRFVDAKVPMVVAGRPFRSDNVSYIDIDNVNAANMAVSHLVRLGRKRIAMINGPTTSTVGIDRREGYLQALRQRGVEPRESLIIESDFTEAGGYYSMQRLLPEKPEAVFAASDIMAVGAMRAAREAGLRVPEDIAFVGFDDLPLSPLSDVQLTTMRQPVAQFGEKAVEVLIDLIEHGMHPPRHIILDTELIIRGSCGAVRSNGTRMPAL